MCFVVTAVKDLLARAHLPAYIENFDTKQLMTLARWTLQFFLDELKSKGDLRASNNRFGMMARHLTTSTGLDAAAWKSSTKEADGTPHPDLLTDASLLTMEEEVCAYAEYRAFSRQWLYWAARLLASSERVAWVAVLTKCKDQTAIGHKRKCAFLECLEKDSKLTVMLHAGSDEFGRREGANANFFESFHDYKTYDTIKI